MERIFDRYTIHEFSDEEIMLELCRRLRLLRQNNGISQGDLAKDARVSLSTIKRIESGEIGNMTLGVLLRILRATGMLGGVAGLVTEIPLPEYKENKRPYFSKIKRRRDV